jgi:hypothetical protein
VAIIQVIRAGESLPFSFDRSGASITGWTCQINVKNFPQDTAIIQRTIEPETSAGWTGFLTSTETAALSNGLFYLIALLDNATTDEEEQVPVRFQVSTPWV